MKRRNRINVTRTVEPLESRQMLAVFEAGGFVYLSNGQGFERFAIENQKWRSRIELADLAEPITAACADANGLYVAAGNSVYRYALEGGTGTWAFGYGYGDINFLASDGNLLIFGQDSIYNVGIFDKTSSRIVGEVDIGTDDMVGLSVAPSLNRVFGRLKYDQPGDIQFVSYQGSGAFLGYNQSESDGENVHATRTWVLPGDTKVVDDSGLVYSTENLQAAGNLGKRIIDLDFTNDGLIISLNADGSLSGYDRRLLPNGSKQIGTKYSRVFVNSENAVVFAADASYPRGYYFKAISLAELGNPQPVARVDPDAVAFTPDEVSLAADGTVLLFSKQHSSIFRFDPTSMRYTQSIPLMEGALDFTYGRETDTAYIAYAGGLLRKVQFSAASTTPELLMTLPSEIRGLAVAGRYLFAAAGNSEGWIYHYTIAPEGSIVSTNDFAYYSNEYIWNDAAQKLFYLRDEVTPNDLQSREIDATGIAYPYSGPGELGNEFETEFHGEFTFTHPLRVSPDGQNVVLGSGHIFNATTLELRRNRLGNPIADAAWLGTSLFSMRSKQRSVVVQQWTGSTLRQGSTFEIAGKADALLAVRADRLLSITVPASGKPAFTLFDPQVRTLASLPHVSRGKLIVSGSSGDDQIRLGLSSTGSRIRVDVNGSISTFKRSEVTSMLIESGNGNDRVDLSDMDRGGVVNLGPGNDTLDAGIGDEKILGGAGNDQINGNSGNDTLDGGDGNDVLRAGTGNDMLLAGAGADSMYGHTGDDQFVLGSRDSAFDLIDGHTGRDRLLDPENQEWNDFLDLN